MVGILTFHKAINYGAVLQAYALRMAVESLGKPCSVINYAAGNILKESQWHYIPHNLAPVDLMLYLYRLPMRAKNVREFEAFLEEYLNLSGHVISCTEDLRRLAYEYSFFITGSDQVFNYTGTGEDFNYYLEFEMDSRKKIAYAPSFGLREVDDAHAERVAENLGSFRALSVREEVGADIVETLTGIRPQIVCDPTFLIAKEQWQQLSVAPRYKEPYVLIYSFGSRHLESVAAKLAEEIGADVVNISRILPTVGCNGVKNACAPGPREFLGLIQNAEIVVTNSFHGMALSILLEKEFYAFTNSYANSGATNCRFETLSRKLGLSDRIYDSAAQVERMPVDYSQISERIRIWREQSLAFLQDALSDD